MIEKLKQNNELWNLFTKEDEYDPMFTDQYDRVPYYLSSYRNIFEPKVSRFLLENGLKPEYPDGKNLQSASPMILILFTHKNYEPYIMHSGR